MDSILFIGILILVFIGIPIALGLLFYFVPKKLGYPKTAKYLTIAYGFFLLTLGLYIAFEDQLFTKNNAKELVEEQGIKLTDDIEILKNESMSGMGDYYHTFTLKISENDRQNAISKIKSAHDYKTINGSIKKLIYQPVPNRYLGKKVFQNYETGESFVREYFKQSDQEGYAPTFRRISINKTKNELTFEDIDE